MPSKREGTVPSYIPFLLILLVGLAGVPVAYVAPSSVEYVDSPSPSALDNLQINSTQSVRRTRGTPISGFWNETYGTGALPETIPTAASTTPPLGGLPISFSWNGYFGGTNYLTPVKNQGSCGSCWAFAAVGDMEAQYQINEANPNTGIDLSEQNVLSCSGGTCSGWYLGSTLDFLRDSGTPDETCNPYVGTKTACGSGRCSDYLSRTYYVTSWTHISTDTANIKNYLYTHGPVMVWMPVFSDFPWYDANFWQYYFYAHSRTGSYTGHFVVIVGWDNQDPGTGDDYWIVRNSWGTSGGDVWGGYGGYFYMTQDPATGFFGIAQEAAVIEDVVPTLNMGLVAPANGATVTSSPVTFQIRVTNSAGAPVEGAGIVVYVNHPYLSITYSCTSSAKSDSNGYFSCDITLADSGTNYRWYATASKSGYRSATSQTWAFNYFAQVTMIVSYSVPGAGTGYSDPVFNYVQGGQSKTYTLTATATDISVDSGSAWSVTPNPLTGSSSSERWYSSQTLSGTASTATIIFAFYHQYLQTLSYAVNGGGSGYSAPSFTANRYGASASLTLTTTATGYWFDADSQWSMMNPLSGSGISERWITTQTTSGAISSAQALAFTYQHQLMLTTSVSPSGGGTISVVSGWQNAGTTVPVTQTPNTGYSFYYWSLDGTNVGTSSSYSVSMNSAHILTAFFRGLSAISLGLSSGTVDLGSSVALSGTITPTQPAGTMVALGYSMDGGTTWNTFITTRIDGSGSYSTTWCPPYPNTYQIKASWGGNANYADASSSTAPLTVTGTAPAQVMLLVTGPPAVTAGSIAVFDVLVTNPGSPLTTTLYIEVTGPGGYEYFDTLQASVGAESTGRYQFIWQAPSTSGTYQVVVGLFPPRPMSISQTQIAVT